MENKNGGSFSGSWYSGPLFNSAQKPTRIKAYHDNMIGTKLEGDERENLVNLHTTELKERFRKVFKREMTPDERRCFFMPDTDGKKSPGHWHHLYWFDPPPPLTRPAFPTEIL